MACTNFLQICVITYHKGYLYSILFTLKEKYWIYCYNFEMKFIWNVNFSTSNATREMKNEHNKTFYYNPKRQSRFHLNSYSCMYTHPKNQITKLISSCSKNIVCFYSRRFIQGWVVTVRNACMNKIKLYLISKYKWKRFRTKHYNIKSWKP